MPLTNKEIYARFVERMKSDKAAYEAYRIAKRDHQREYRRDPEYRAKNKASHVAWKRKKALGLPINHKIRWFPKKSVTKQTPVAAPPYAPPIIICENTVVTFD